MIPVNNRPATEESELNALLAFDRALAAGQLPPSSEPDASLLQGVHECQRLLEAVWPRSVPSPFELPKQLGRFSIERELGRGGFGVVFLAEDSALGRRVALKVPHPEVLVTPEFRRRFLREAEAASRLDHPHIVPVYEVGDEGPVCYIASAYCEGVTLAQWLRSQSAPIPIRVACRLVAVVAGAVGHAHERGILHRDLKPGNILLQELPVCVRAQDSLGFHPRICDFGLAKLLDQVGDETRSGMPIGSPAYMAPEQAAGRIREHGPATDVYALGVILYEVLTGRQPHRGETDLETVRLVSDTEPQPLRTLRAGLPRDLETVVQKCLEKRPARRYSSAAELLADLERFLDGKPVQARPVRMWTRAGKWARRRPVHAALLILLGASALAVLAALGWMRVRDDEMRLLVNRSRRVEAEASDQRALASRHRLLAQQHHVAHQLKVAGALVERQEHEPARAILESLRPSGELGDLRGFPWFYLHRIVTRAVTLLPALPAGTRAVAYAHDGRTIAVADDLNNTFLIDRDTGRMRELPANHRLRLCMRLVFSPDDSILASLSCGGQGFGAGTEVKLWNVASCAELGGMPEDFGVCYRLVFSPDGSTIVTVEAVWSTPNPPVRSWKLSRDRRRVTLGESLRSEQLRAALSPSNRTVASARRSFRLTDVVAVSPEEQSTTAVWTETGEIWLYMMAEGYCKAVCRAVGPNVVFIPRTDHMVPYSKAVIEEIGRQACALTGSASARPLLEDVAVLAVRFSRDGRTVAALERDHAQQTVSKLRLIDVAGGWPALEFPWGNSWHGCDFDFAPDEDALAVVGRDTQPMVWNFKHWRSPSALSGHEKEVWGLAFSRDGQTITSSSDDGTIKLWDVASGREQRNLEGHVSLVTAIAYSPDGTVLASAGWDAKVRLWNSASGVLLSTFSGHTGHVRTVAFSPDGKTLASGDDDGAIRLWDVAILREWKAPLIGHAKNVAAVVFAPDGNTLYSGGEDTTIRVWDWKERRCRAVWHTDYRISSLALAPDSQTLAAAHLGGTIGLWDVARQQPRAHLRGHAGDVLCLAYSPDGLTLASGGRDKSVRLWDPVTGQELLAIQGHLADVHGIAFSPDGTILASGSHDGAIKLWYASSAATHPGAVKPTLSAATSPGH